ncbi:FkbM family methyltransferase [Nostoc sp. 106C]|uniref:FkbM family methyltransferase n=1 Tax=Nostoc sp. 106C TaxID=1932667 RepID=UPI000A373B04|nr:FkbM family methyltransferase [Nostoc sp. 106C]OUL30810.1 hypothetical protein BV375_13450 [Nostoc sp. 106C]
MKSYLNRPEYIFRPAQIYYRIFKQNFKHINFKETILPWGAKIRIPTEPHDTVGKSIATYGIYDLSLTEVLWRLINPGETVIDIGANIGYMTSIMSKRVGNTGKVWCFEPNPEVYKELSENINNWQQKQGWDNIYAKQIALSNTRGTGVLNIPLINRGEAFIELGNSINPEANKSQACTVILERLDKFLENEQKHIGLLKIDVEGHELQVLQGAGELISKNNIRDILFEDHHGYPSNVTQLLEMHGYTIFRIWKGFWKPVLESPSKNLVHRWEPPNYLATHNPKRAAQCLKDWGWKCLSTK